MDSRWFERVDGSAAADEEKGFEDTSESTQVDEDIVSVRQDAAEVRKRINVAYAVRYYSQKRLGSTQPKYGDGWVYKNAYRSWSTLLLLSMAL